MMLFYVIAVVMFVAGALLMFLFYMLRKESIHPASVVPIMPAEIKEPPGFQKRIEELEEEMRGISDKAVVQAQEAMTMIETLTKENAELKAEAEQGQKAKMAEVEQSLDRLRQDNSALQGQLETGQGKVKELQDEIIAVRKHMGDELLAANAEIVTLKAAPTPAPTSAEEIEQLKQAVDEARKENEALRHETTKHRAQASGFERMCDNYKAQLEQALARAGASEQIQVELQATKNRLEVVLRAMEKQNEEFTKREKLSQFELEKTRTQLVDLEKAYEEIKLKVKETAPETPPEVS